MQFGRAFRHGIAGNLDSLVNRMRICAFLSGAFVKPTEFTIGDADVRVIEMPVDVVISRPPVFFAPDGIGEFAERIEVVGFIKCNAFVKGQPLICFNLCGDFV